MIRSLAFANAMGAIEARANDKLTLISPLSADEERTVGLKAALEERSRLGSLLKHGLSKTASFAAQDQTLSPIFRQWLLRYHERRIEVISALLSGWGGAEPDLPKNESKVSKSEVQTLVTNLERLGNFVGRNEEILVRYGWGNGILSENPPTPPVDFVTRDWSETYQIVSAIPEATAFILEELVINAFKHGAPGVGALVEAIPVQSDGSNWIQFTISNDIAAFDQPTSEATRTYGGLTLVREACRRLHWQFDPPERNGGQHVVKVRARTITEVSTKGNSKASAV